MKRWIILFIALLLTAVGVGVWNRPVKVPPKVAAAPTTAPVIQPATAPTLLPVVRAYLDVVRANHPDFPTTQPLYRPLQWSEAARLIFPNHVYLGPPPRSDLWITHADAPGFAELIKQKDFARQQIYVVRERVAYVHWLNPEPPDDAPRPILVISWSNGRPPTFLDRSGKLIALSLPATTFDWPRAEWWNNKLVVPGAGVCAVISFAPTLNCIVTTFGNTARVWFCPDAAGGLLAWSDVENDTVRRFVDDSWTTLPPTAGWSSRALQLVPLLDGSVLQIASGPKGEEDKVDLQLILLAEGAANVDEKRLAELVDQLSDLSQRKRDAATDELSRYGPEAWSVLEKLIVDQPPEVTLRMKRVMGNRLQPTLAGMKLVDGQMKLVTRLSDGGCVFYANSGVSIARRDGTEDVVAPAWISVRPGRPIARLPDALVRDLRPDSARLDAFGEEWIVTDDARGPQRLLGNRLVKLLRDDERAAGFGRVVGIDRRGRWLFRKTSDDANTGPTLIVDLTLPDSTPRLPAWTFAEAKEAGWTHDGWPAVRKGSTWSLREEGWQLEDPKSGDAMLTRVENLPPQHTAIMTANAAPTATADATSATTTRSTAATTQHAADATTTLSASATTQPLSAEDRFGPVLLTFPDRSRVFDGLSKLVVVSIDGHETTWPLPADVVGRPPFPVTLLSTKGDVLFLFNQPGRVIRLKRTKDDFKVEATFTKDVPATGLPTRIWLDPAGRIAFVWDNKLTVLFPQGMIPPGIRNLMTGTGDE